MTGKLRDKVASPSSAIHHRTIGRGLLPSALVLLSFPGGRAWVAWRIVASGIVRRDRGCRTTLSSCVDWQLLPHSRVRAIFVTLLVFAYIRDITAWPLGTYCSTDTFLFRQHLIIQTAWCRVSAIVIVTRLLTFWHLKLSTTYIHIFVRLYVIYMSS